MALGDFVKRVIDVLTPTDNIRAWRKAKRLYRRSLRDKSVNPKDLRQFMQAWMKENPKPKRTKREREKIYSDIPQVLKEGVRLVEGDGGNGSIYMPPSESLKGPGVAKAKLSPFLLLLLVPLFFPNLLKNF